MKRVNDVVTVCVLCLFLMVTWVGMLSVIVTFLGHTHLFFQFSWSLGEFVVVWSTVAHLEGFLTLAVCELEHFCLRNHTK